jgi:hypothetical protein
MKKIILACLITFLSSNFYAQTNSLNPYDYEFNIHNQNYYCSEFVANILNSISNFKFIPTKTNNSFEYYSADFFMSDSRFKQVHINEINQLTKQ